VEVNVPKLDATHCAIGSLAGFLKVGQAFWYLGYFGLELSWNAFYDDYTLLSNKLENSSKWAREPCLICWA
jgi:hypothetical protein